LPRRDLGSSLLDGRDDVQVVLDVVDRAVVGQSIEELPELSQTPVRVAALLGRLRGMARPAHIREQALALSEQERAELARDLILSLDGEPDPDATEKWAEVIERRARAVLDGTAELVDGKAALDRVRARLNDRGE